MIAGKILMDMGIWWREF